MALGLAAVLAVLISRQDLEYEELVFLSELSPACLEVLRQLLPLWPGGPIPGGA